LTAFSAQALYFQPLAAAERSAVNDRAYKSGGLLLLSLF
jgi:hypothetical protein